MNERPYPEHAIARLFARIYYDVAQRRPTELSLLYKSDSTLAHGALRAHGSYQIALIARTLPIAGQRARLFSVTAQRVRSGGYVVVTLGALPDDRVFTQTFLLERTGLSVNSFYCRNDVFSLIPLDAADAESSFAHDAPPNYINIDDLRQTATRNVGAAARSAANAGIVPSVTAAPSRARGAAPDVQLTADADPHSQRLYG